MSISLAALILCNREKIVGNYYCENIISKNGEHSFRYAVNVLNGRFKLGEPSISKCYYWDVYYYLHYEELMGYYET